MNPPFGQKKRQQLKSAVTNALLHPNVPSDNLLLVADLRRPVAKGYEGDSVVGKERQRGEDGRLVSSVLTCCSGEDSSELSYESAGSPETTRPARAQPARLNVS